MSDTSKNRPSSRRPTKKAASRTRNTYTTKSGKTIKVNRSFKERLQFGREQFARKRAERMAGMPKSRLKRFFFRLQPKRLYKYWFSREGAVMALKITGIAIIAGFLLMVGIFAYFRKDLPNIKDISGNNIGGSVRYYDRSGQTMLWEDVNGVKRIPVHNEEISQYMKDATVAVEDKDFFKHGGFDVRGIMRAAVNDAVGSGGKQGGSTITQQLVRLTQSGVGRQQTITRKIKELILAVELEREYSKQDILVGYLNTAPYGGIEYGVEAGAQNYFHKSAKDLTLDEAAMLASIPKAPCAYSYYCAEGFNQQALKARQNYILDQMKEQGKITTEQRDAAKKIDTVAKIQARPNHYDNIKAPYFVLAARSELESRYSATADRSGWKITTTLDMNLQNKAEKLVTDNLKNITVRTAGRADSQATVMEDIHTGQIVALVGGTDFSNPTYGKINYAHDAFIAPGSSFKPYDYATLIDNNVTAGAGSVIYDSTGPLPGYPCTDKSAPAPKGTGNCLTDYDFLTPGPITMRYALGGSRNIPAVKAMLMAVPNDTSAGKVNSINKVISTANKMMANPYNPNTYQCYQQGVDINTATQEDVTQCYGASAIGDGAFLHLDDHVNGIATIARLGTAIPRTYIMEINDSAGKLIYQYKQPQGNQVLKPDSAYIVSDMASDPRASYLPGSCSDTNCSGYKFHRYNGWKFAIKTGTTNSGFDGLMASWSNKYAVVSWVGNHTRNIDITAVTRTSMEYLTEPLTQGMMYAGHTGLKADNWVQPAGLKSLPSFVMQKNIHYGDLVPSPTNDLYPSWYVAPNKTASGPQVIDTISNKLATDCTPNLARKTVTNANSSNYSIDIFVTGGPGGTTTQDKDDVHVCGEAPPSVTIASSPTTCSSACTVRVSVSQGAKPLSSGDHPGKLNVMIAGQTVQAFDIDGAGSDIPLTFTYKGTGTQSVSVQVVDSVLYDATSAAVQINFTGSSSDLSLNQPGFSGNTATFSWSGGTGPYTVTVKGPAPGNINYTCKSASNTCQISPLLPAAGNFTAYVTEDTTGSQSSTITFQH